MEQNQSDPIVQRSVAQEVLISKLLHSRKLRDKEFKEMKLIWETQVLTMTDASFFIEHLLALLKFRRRFNSKNKKCYKICHYCKSRDKITRIEYVKSGVKFWSCETCLINIPEGEFVIVPRKSNNGN